jgi:hypothetical protein
MFLIPLMAVVIQPVRRVNEAAQAMLALQEDSDYWKEKKSLMLRGRV